MRFYAFSCLLAYLLSSEVNAGYLAISPAFASWSLVIWQSAMEINT
jgi:hypothetical protein